MTKAEAIADELCARIAAGRYTPGDALPSARGIRDEWGVALATASRVHALVRATGVAETVAGIGVVVRERPPTRVGGVGAMPAGDARTPAASARRGSTRAGGRTASDRAAVARVAVRIADAEGLDAVSFRRLGHERGTSAMSVYRHVDDRADLVSAMLDHVMRQWRSPRPDGAGWAACVEAAARGLWAILGHHPWAAGAFSLTRPQAIPSAAGWTEWVLTALVDAGVDLHTAFDVHLTVFSFVRGLASDRAAESAARADSGVDADEWIAAHDADLRSLSGPGRPHLGALVADGYDFDLDRLFDRGLAALLDGFAQRLGLDQR